MGEHIGGLLREAMESIRAMVDVNTVIGDPFETGNGTVIVPLSRVCVGLAAGGGEYGIGPASGESPQQQREYPFGGGSGAGISVTPVGFLVTTPDGSVRMLNTKHQYQPLERLIELTPTVLEKLANMGKRAEKEIVQE
ncbi:MAG TPA: GerW family sporulation protein [Symbiobacteriaceae bacterium]|nr:GerW family sporulation protein [Symbiobacteriaceae bacterium]